MKEFIAATMGYPTVVFTALLLVAVSFWMLSLIGLVGMDALDFDVDVDADADVDIDADADAAEQAAGAGFWQKAPIRVIPLTVALSLFFFFGWMVCHVTTLFLGSVLSGLLPVAIWGTGVLLGGAFVSLVLTNIVAIPIAPVFRNQASPRKRDLVGRIVEIRTGRVDEKFGTGLAEDGGAGLLVEVRCQPDLLKRGDKALVIHYNKQLDAYEVEPLEKALKP